MFTLLICTQIRGLMSLCINILLVLIIYTKLMNGFLIGNLDVFSPTSCFNQDCFTVEGEDLRHDFERLQLAMEMVGFLPKTRRQ